MSLCLFLKGAMQSIALKKRIKITVRPQTYLIEDTSDNVKMTAISYAQELHEINQCTFWFEKRWKR